MKPKEAVIRGVENLPADLLLKSRGARERLETVILSEGVLARDWSRPEEKVAWHDL